MAREMTKKAKRFSLEESDAIEENERILESGSQLRKENRENQEETAKQSAPSNSADIMLNARKPKGKKTENGITIYVPMEYYERIALMKMRTGVPIKDLALQAVIEFLDRNKM
jgi:hypothetical protein